MIYRDKCVHTEQLGAWQVHFYEVAGTDGTYLCTSAELLLNGDRKGRLTLVRPGLTVDEVIAQMRPRVLSWLEEYNQRDHSGSTGFGSLG